MYMKKGLIAISILLSNMSLLSAKATNKSCTDVPAGTYSCNPYQFNFIRVKEVKYQDQTKLVADKLQPIPPKNGKKSTIADMIEKHIKLNEPIRYQGEKQNITTNVSQEDLHYYISLAKQLKQQRESLIFKIIKEEEARYNKHQFILKEHKYQPEKNKEDFFLIAVQGGYEKVGFHLYIFQPHSKYQPHRNEHDHNQGRHHSHPLDEGDSFQAHLLHDAQKYKVWRCAYRGQDPSDTCPVCNTQGKTKFKFYIICQKQCDGQ
jgi:hypothetical protein